LQENSTDLLSVANIFERVRVEEHQISKLAGFNASD
jgi:hypothetical protein